VPGPPGSSREAPASFFLACAMPFRDRLGLYVRPAPAKMPACVRGEPRPMSLIRRVIVALLPVVALAGLIALVVAVGGCARDATAPAAVATGPVDRSEGGRVGR